MDNHGPTTSVTTSTAAGAPASADALPAGALPAGALPAGALPAGALPAGALHDVRLVVNGAVRDARVPARRLLSDCLRHDLGLTGTHVGCEHGVCGACTVLLDGDAVRSCLLFAVSADGAAITTVEGLTGADGTLSAVQRAFSECHGLQCGFCTPGFLVTITAGLRANPHPTQAEAREMVGGNLCRCTGYANIVRSVLRAAEIGDERAANAHSPAARPAGNGTAGTERTGTERTGTERTGTERTGTERTGTERTGTERTGTERTGTERTGTGLTGTGPAGVGPAVRP